MEATELMIGDWVYIPPIAVNRIEYFTKVTGIGKDVILFNKESGYDNVSLERVNPIPLTAEILKKNGFVFNSCGRRYWYEGFGLALDYGARSKELYLRLFRINRHVHIHYVHELQHALRLCGLTDLADNFKV